MKGHTLVNSKQKDGTWNYSCTCKRVKKVGLKLESSALTLHKAHLALVERYVKSH